MSVGEQMIPAHAGAGIAILARLHDVIPALDFPVAAVIAAVAVAQGAVTCT
jgi:hypothetical protein